MARRPSKSPASPAELAANARYFAVVGSIGVTVARSTFATRGALAPTGPATIPTEEEADFTMGA